MCSCEFIPGVVHACYRTNSVKLHASVFRIVVIIIIIMKERQESAC